MASFKQMRVDGVIKRADAEKIRWEDIHVEPGFNLSGRNDEEDEDDEALYQHVMSGGMLPDLEVRPREDGGVWLVDGHRRHKQIGRADKAGAPLRDPKDGQLWVSVVQFVGNDVKRTVRLLTSARRKDPSALQVAEVYARMERFGLSPEEIGNEFQKTRQHVDQMLILAHANADVHRYVKEGRVSATVAVDMVRKHGELAGAFIVAAADKTGGKRVTAAAVKPWSPPAKLVAPLVETLPELLRNINPNTFHKLLELEQSGSIEVMRTSIDLPSTLMLALIRHASEIGDARTAAEQKARDKAAKTAQADIGEAV